MTSESTSPDAIAALPAAATAPPVAETPLRTFKDEGSPAVCRSTTYHAVPSSFTFTVKSRDVPSEPSEVTAGDEAPNAGGVVSAVVIWTGAPGSRTRFALG